MFDCVARESLKIGIITINIWGIFVVFGFIFALFIALYRAKKEKIATNHIWNVALIAVFLGLIGARLLYILENLAYFLKNPLSAFNLYKIAGLSFFGGFVLAGLGIWIYIEKTELKNIKKHIFDLLAAPVLLAMTVGRIGCFLAHDHLGRVMQNPNFLGVKCGAAVYHDPALYLFLTNLALFLLFLFLYDKIKKNGIQAIMFVAAVSVSRLGWDYFRTDQRICSLTIAQWISICVLLTFGLLTIKYLFSERNKL